MTRTMRRMGVPYYRGYRRCEMLGPLLDRSTTLHAYTDAYMHGCTCTHAYSRILTHAHACMCAMYVWQVELVPGLEHVLGLRPCPPSQPCSKLRPLNPRHRRASSNLRVSAALYLSLAPAHALPLLCACVYKTEREYVRIWAGWVETCCTPPHNSQSTHRPRAPAKRARMLVWTRRCWTTKLLLHLV